jgi:FMN reductase
MNSNGPVVVVVGNPGGPGRTGAAARVVAERIAAVGTTDGDRGRAIVEIDLADGPERLLAWGSPLAAEHRATIDGARALVVATPTYKAAYTGLLKLFLDQVGAGELAGIPTVAVMTGGSDAHALAIDVHLAPVLVELGASLPARGVYLAGPAVDDPVPGIEAWWVAAEAPLTRALT